MNCNSLITEYQKITNIWEKTPNQPNKSGLKKMMNHVDFTLIVTLNLILQC